MRVEPPGAFKYPAGRKRIPRSAGSKNSNRTMEEREFIAWDGEGWTDHKEDHKLVGTPPDCRGGCPHHYFLFGASTGEHVRADSLPTIDCFEVMLEVARENRTAIHVAFAFDYDVNMICKDLPRPVMARVNKGLVTRWKGYLIEYRSGKWFRVSSEGISCQINDVFSFFACSFVKALRGWGVGGQAEIDAIESGKSQRGTFTLAGLDETVIPYWKSELRLLVQLANKLREILYSGGINITRWYGPGAIANQLYKDKATATYIKQDLPEEILDAGQVAYAGGRFETFRAGYYEGDIYSADINSAYPYAMSALPNLATGRWRHVTGRDVRDLRESIQRDPGEYRLGMCRLRYVYNRDVTQLATHEGFPLVGFYKRKGNLSFPTRSGGVWLHLPEARIMFEQDDAGMFSSFELLEMWLFEDDGSYPFAWVSEMYAQRKCWKDEGNPAQLAAKLGLNALYGKLAQTLGGTVGHLPPWHQLEWSGHITSTCRSMLYRASVQDYEGLIAYETDGVYSTRPFSHLPGGAGSGLGEWELSSYTGILYLQNGVYWLRDADGNWLPPKSRGVPQAALSFDAGMEALRTGEPIQVWQNGFVKFGSANMRHMRGWRTWERTLKEIRFGGAEFGKRMHAPWCVACAKGISPAEGLHPMSVRPAGHDVQHLMSEPHDVPWRRERFPESRGGHMRDLRDGIKQMELMFNA